MSNKKASIIILALLVGLVTVLAGCSKDSSKNNAPADQQNTSRNTTTNEPAAGDTGLSEPGTLPIVKSGTQQLRVATVDNYYAPKSLTSGLEVWNEVEKKTGIKINWDVAPASQYYDAMKIRMAAAKDLPDLINLPIEPTQAASQGLIVPLDDLIDKYAPNIKQFFTDNPNLRNLMKAPDGKVYALGGVVSGAAFADPYGVLVRQDWLDKLGLQQPETPDEWYTVLKAFKERDPNGNGKPDELPYSSGDDMKIEGLYMLGGAFNMHLIYSLGYVPDANGKIQFEWMQPKGEQFVTWLSKLYKDGLIDPQFLTNGDAETLSNITRNLVGATNHFVNNINRYNAALKSSGVDANWQLTLPPGPEHGKGVYEKYGPLSGWFGISKDAKNPELAIRWLDYIYASEEGNRYMCFGIEGKSYKMVNGQPEFTDWVAHNPDGLSFNEALRSLGAMPTVPWIRSEKPPLNQQPLATLRKDPPLQKQAARVKDYLVDAAPFGLPSVEEAEQTASIATDIKTYLDENLSKYITGQQPIDWEKFTAGLKSIGIDKMIEVRQAQYDRFKNG
jgi:putative aldouronate transport system substrate-binding protein